MDILNLIKKKNIKVIVSKDLKKPNGLMFLLQKGFVIRSGIIPYTIKNGKYYLLLGVKKYQNTLDSLGGGCKLVETTFDCAMREFLEESRETINIDINNITHILITGRARPHQAILLVEFPNIGDEENIFQDSLKSSSSNMYKKQFNEMEMLKWIMRENIFVEFPRDKVEDSLKSLYRYLFDI